MAEVSCWSDSGYEDSSMVLDNWDQGSPTLMEMVTIAPKTEGMAAAESSSNNLQKLSSQY